MRNPEICYNCHPFQESSSHWIKSEVIKDKNKRDRTTIHPLQLYQANQPLLHFC